MMLRQQIKTLRTELEAVHAENAALKAELARARQAAPKPRRRRDLAQYLYPTVPRQERP
jgi:cell division protein FtsB